MRPMSDGADNMRLQTHMHTRGEQVPTNTSELFRRPETDNQSGKLSDETRAWITELTTFIELQNSQSTVIITIPQKTEDIS